MASEIIPLADWREEPTIAPLLSGRDQSLRAVVRLRDRALSGLRWESGEIGLGKLRRLLRTDARATIPKAAG